jgi:hypothetical protein
MQLLTFFWTLFIVRFFYGWTDGRIDNTQKVYYCVNILSSQNFGSYHQQELSLSARSVLKHEASARSISNFFVL